MARKLIREPLYRLTQEFKDQPELIEEYIYQTFDLINKVENVLKAYITLRNLKNINLDARNIIKEIRKNGYKNKKLFGVLIAVKDNIVIKGIRTTCASKMLNDFIPPYTATAVNKILREGAIILGKTNMDEFAMGSTTENSAFFITRNPWDPERVPGGSSGGSAVATAAYECTASLGSDTGGSIRAPAAFTGTVGLKPTYGLVSRYGLIAYANSLEQIGPIARTVRDAAILLSVIGGYDPKDSTSLAINRSKLDYESYVTEEPIKKYRIAVIKEMTEEGIDNTIKSSFSKALSKLSNEGFDIDEVSLPIIKYALPTYYIIAMAEASSNLARYDGIRYGYHIPVEGKTWTDIYSLARSEGFGPEVRRRIIIGSFVLSAGYYDQYYLRASKVRKLLYDEIRNLFSKYDVIASPTMPILPPRLGEKITDPLQLYAMDVNTVVANLVGIPAISIPSDLIGDLPVGLQFMGPELSEGYLFNLAHIYEMKSHLQSLVPNWVSAHV
jgi:aspartyl-tRNA(Asn)/glutamyl-tRNA(Gln) amidotransferase subunit A